MTDRKTLKKIRNQRVDLEGTPPAIFLNSGDVAVDTNSGGWVVDFTEESSTKRLYPYSIISITNNSTSDLNVYINQRRDWQKVVRAGVKQTIADFKGIRTVRISKRDATVTLTGGEVEINVERPPLNDDEFRRRELRQPLIMKILKNFVGV